MLRLTIDKGKQRKIFISIIFIGLLMVVGKEIYSSFFANQELMKTTTNAQLAPHFALNDLAGGEHDLADYKGKGVLINFWATYCPPCEKEMPYLESAYQDYKDQGIEILAVNVKEPMRIVDQFVSKKELSFPILLDRYGDIAGLYKVLNLPMTILVNEDGEIEKEIVGEMSEEDIRRYMEQIKPR